jgi:two-component system response regulator PilR (NtrC family)
MLGLRHEEAETPSGGEGPGVELPLPRPLDDHLEEMERRIILQALEESGWNRTRASQALGGISRTTLIGKMKRMGLFADSRGRA